MRVVLDRAVFDDPAVDALSLLHLIAACRRPSPHFVVLRPGWGTPVDRWMGQWPERVRRDLTTILRDTVENARRGRALTIVVEPAGARRAAGASAAPRVNVERAIAMVREPLRVLVENRRNDGRFITRLAVATSHEERAFFRQAIDRGWIVFEQGGGLSEVLHLLVDLDAAVADPVLCPQGDGREIRRWRLMVVVDRDTFEERRPKSIDRDAWAPRPRDPTRPSQVSTEVMRRALLVLPTWAERPGAHQLRRRAIENYIPLRAMRAWIDLATTPATRRDRRASVDALARLDVRQEDRTRPYWYFGMKDGFEGDKPTGLKAPPTEDAHVHAIFHALSTSERLALRKGFTTRSESIADLLFDRDLVSDAWLREELTRDGDTEAQDVVHDMLNRI